MINSKNAKKYCCEDLSLIENYSEAVADETQMWDLHHRLEVQGESINSMKLLKKCGMYYNRPASELIFLTHAEHIRLHAKADRRGKHAGKKQPREAKVRNGKTTGKKPWWNDGTVNRRAFERPGPGWVRGQLGDTGITSKGMLYWNDGTRNKRAKECPGPEWVRGRLRRSQP